MNSSIDETIIELEEYKNLELEKDDISNEIGLFINKNYHNIVDVEFPSIGNNNKWTLKPSSWVGFIRVSDDFKIRIKPKVKLQNIFLMFEYAYSIKEIKFSDDPYDCNSLEEFYNILARILAKRVNDRITKGLYGNYIDFREKLPYVRGRLIMNNMIKKPWDVSPTCYYQDHTRDIEDNQILAWTLHIIRRNCQSTPVTKSICKKSMMGLLGAVSLKNFSANDTVNRFYNRLNDDYQVLHFLCKFFLENSGPSLDNGKNQMLSFRVNMNVLYEKFVAEWLKKHVKFGTVKSQEEASIDENNNLKIKIDIVLYNHQGEPIAVLDTKYKKTENINSDIYQITTYAVRKKCKYAILIYPRKQKYDIRVSDDLITKAMCFSLDGDIEKNGEKFLNELKRTIDEIYEI